MRSLQIAASLLHAQDHLVAVCPVKIQQSIRDQGPTPIPGCVCDLNKLSTIHTKGHELEIIVVHKLLSQVHRTAAEPGSNYSSVIGF